MWPCGTPLFECLCLLSVIYVGLCNRRGEANQYPLEYMYFAWVNRWGVPRVESSAGDVTVALECWECDGRIEQHVAELTDKRKASSLPPSSSSLLRHTTPSTSHYKPTAPTRVALSSVKINGLYGRHSPVTLVQIWRQSLKSHTRDNNIYQFRYLLQLTVSDLSPDF